MVQKPARKAEVFEARGWHSPSVQLTSRGKAVYLEYDVGTCCWHVLTYILPLPATTPAAFKLHVHIAIISYLVVAALGSNMQNP